MRNRTPDFLHLRPVSRVPALQDLGEVIYLTENGLPKRKRGANIQGYDLRKGLLGIIGAVTGSHSVLAADEATKSRNEHPFSHYPCNFIHDRSYLPAQ